MKLRAETLRTITLYSIPLQESNKLDVVKEQLVGQQIRNRLLVSESNGSWQAIDVMKVNSRS